MLTSCIATRVAQWPDGSANTAPVTPVQVTPGEARIAADVHLAKELDWLDPAFDAEVYPTATLRWSTATVSALPTRRSCRPRSTRPAIR